LKKLINEDKLGKLIVGKESAQLSSRAKSMGKSRMQMTLRTTQPRFKTPYDLPPPMMMKDRLPNLYNAPSLSKIQVIKGKIQTIVSKNNFQNKYHSFERKT